jgi:hypothetical protein
MTVYVVEIEGRSVAAFNDESLPEAKHFPLDGAFAFDLMTLIHDGKPLWDGASFSFAKHFRRNNTNGEHRRFSRLRLVARQTALSCSRNLTHRWC